MYPQRFSALPAYAFPRLRALLDHLPSGGEPIAMTIGEPQHAFPEFVPEVLAAHVSGFNKYPPTMARQSCLKPSPLGLVAGSAQKLMQRLRF